jgi:hypothetical protein
MNTPRRERNGVAIGRLVIRRSGETLEHVSRMGRAGFVAAMLVYQYNIYVHILVASSEVSEVNFLLSCGDCGTII